MIAVTKAINASRIHSPDQCIGNYITNGPTRPFSGEQKFLGAKFLDVVAQLSRLFKLELLRRLAHIRFQLADVASSSCWVLNSGIASSWLVRSAYSALRMCASDISSDRMMEVRRDAVLLVVRLLHGAPAVGLIERATHRVGHHVGVQDGSALQVTRRASDGLDQRPRGAQKAFLVSIENRDQRNLRQIEALRASRLMPISTSYSPRRRSRSSRTRSRVSISECM